MSKTTPFREPSPSHRRAPRPKFLQRLARKFFSDPGSPSAAERREAVSREKGLPPSPSTPSSEPAFSADQLYSDASLEGALRKRAWLPPLPEEGVLPTLSAPVSQSPSNQSQSAPELREKHDHDGGRDPTTLEDRFRMKPSLERRQTAAELIKAEWEARQSQAESSSDALRGLRGPPQPDVEKPNAPSADGPVAVSTTKDLPLLDTNHLAHCSSPPTSLSGETLHLRQPLELKVYTQDMMAAELEKIDDEVSRRLTRLAFMI